MKTNTMITKFLIALIAGITMFANASASNAAPLTTLERVKATKEYVANELNRLAHRTPNRRIGDPAHPGFLPSAVIITPDMISISTKVTKKTSKTETRNVQLTVTMPENSGYNGSLITGTTTSKMNKQTGTLQFGAIDRAWRPSDFLAGLQDFLTQRRANVEQLP